MSSIQFDFPLLLLDGQRTRGFEYCTEKETPTVQSTGKYV
jgi:hypothetical protein